MDGRQVRVHGALPGERIEVDGTGSTARLVGVVQASPDRVLALCPVADRCGGCAWQHAAPEVQRAARLDRLRRSLPPALRDIPIEEHPSAVGYGWRTRARLAWRHARGATVLGFRAHGSTEIVDAPGCVVLVPTLSDALHSLRGLLDKVAPSGEVSLAIGAEGRAVVSIHPDGRTAMGFEVPDALVALGFAGAALWAPGASVPAVAGDPRPRLPGADGRELLLGLDGFAQAHAGLNGELALYVAEQAETEGRQVVELYAGAGNFTVLLAPRAARMTAVESDPGSVEALRQNLASRGLDRVFVRSELAESVAKDLRADVVVLDPPRTGAREVVETLPAVRRIVYISCDPATLGRDLGILHAGYEVDSLAIFEMFPQTPHAEVVATLSARRRTSRRPGPASGATPSTG